MKQPFDIEQVNVMSWMRFPLIIGVVMAHCNLYALVETWEGISPEWPEWIVYIFKYLYWIVLPARVPTLFIISGYFFFRSRENRGVHFFAEKFRRRIHSLLIPYIVWNAVAILVMYLRYNIVEGCNYSVTDYLSGFWSSTINNNGLPANAPLWFMRNLMVVSLLSPVIHYLLKEKWGLITIAAAAFCYIKNIEIPVDGINIEALLFFSVGAYIAIHKIDITAIPNHIGITTLLLYIPVQLLMNHYYNNAEYVYAIGLLASIIKVTAVFYLVSLLFKKNIIRPTIFLSKMSFTLYALHGIIIGPIIMVLYRLSGNTDNPIVLLGIYIATPLIIITVTYILYSILTKHTPKIAGIVTGNRG